MRARRGPAYDADTCRPETSLIIDGFVSGPLLGEVIALAIDDLDFIESVIEILRERRAEILEDQRQPLLDAITQAEVALIEFDRARGL